MYGEQMCQHVEPILVTALVGYVMFWFYLNFNMFTSFELLVLIPMLIRVWNSIFDCL